MGKPTKTAGAKKKPGDFKRPKRKVGRKAPQAANVTSVAVASRRINMLEQSALLDKGDAAKTHRHATLQELLANAGHYNAHMRQRALQGLRELAQLHGDNVLANVAVVLERFLRTFVDEEAIVREAAVQAWKVLIAVMVEGKSLRPFAKLIAMYFCSGLTHLQIGIRQDTLRAISVLLEAAPELLSVDAGLDQLGRLIENFRDLIAAAQTQGIKITNQYDVLNSGGNGTGSSKTKKQGKDLHQHGSSGGNLSASTQKKPATSALTLRFSALTVLHKLLHSIDFSSDCKMNSTAKTMRDVHRMAAVGDTPALLLYASPILVLGNQSDLLRSVGFWQEKSRTLLRPLLDLWLECFGESDVLETLPEEYVENLQRIIECATVIVSANVDQLKEDAGEKQELLKTTRKLQEQLLARFPMFPGDNLTAGGDAYLSRWYGINVALARFACVKLQLPPSIRSASAADLDGQVTQFVVSAMAKYAASDELRALASTHGIMRGLLDVLTSVLASLPSPQQRDELLDTFTQLYVKCSPRSMTFRTCSSFVIERLSDFTRWPSWPIVLQWLTCFGNFMGQLDATHMALGRQCLFTMISVMKQLPTELATNGAADSVLQNLEGFFNLTTQDSTQFRFHDLSASDQLEFVPLVYHLPSYPVGLLRALASCCKSARVHLDAKSFLMDILHQRIEVLDLAHFVSFLMSGILGRVQGDKTEPWTLDQKQQHLQLTRHVCRVLLNMNMGASLAKILTPALSRQAAALGDMEPLDLHTLVLLYGACFASVKPIHRGELPVDMVTTVVDTVSSALVTFPDSQPQELELLEDLVAMISLSDNVVRCIVDSLLQYATVDVAETITKKLRALQLLVQAAPLQPWFVEHNAFAMQRLDAFEASNASKATEHVTRLARQVRGDLQLVRVGHTKP